jgi:hypothetical protein
VGVNASPKRLHHFIQSEGARHDRPATPGDTESEHSIPAIPERLSLDALAPYIFLEYVNTGVTDQAVFTVAPDPRGFKLA